MSDQDLVGLVEPLQGTDSVQERSHGNTSPLVARPWGMTAWTPQTREGLWIYKHGDVKFHGIRMTHQPAPWMGDYGHLTIMPVIGQVGLTAHNRSSSFRPAEQQVHPDYYQVFLMRYRTRIECTASERCGVLRFTFPQTDDARLLIQPVVAASQISIDPDQRTLCGFTRGKSLRRGDGGGSPDNFACYFVMQFDRPITGHGLVSGGERPQWLHDQSSGEGETLGGYVRFDVRDGQPVVVRVGTSFISIEQARRNLQREIAGRSLEQVRAECAEAWNKLLSRVTLEGATRDQRRTFYSAMYRALLFPRKFYEFDENDRPIHYSPYDGQVHPGVLYADNGFWDTYRTVYPLLIILYPDYLGEILEGWVQAAREGGWFPKWASPGYRAAMIGTHIDVVMADAIVKGIEGFSREDAYQFCLRNATEPGPDHRKWGRLGLQHFIERGYVPADLVANATSRTLDFAYDDFAVAQIARVMGDYQQAEKLMERSRHYRNVFDASVGFMRGRNADGSWLEPFNPVAWGGPFVECSAWQGTWAVPHDVEGLMSLFGGAEPFVQKLQKMLTMPPEFHIGTYPCEVHEMTEMAGVDFGQYAHCNQPVHHVLYLFAAAGRPDLTRHYVRRVVDELYRATPNGLPGDEDNGEMSSWYLLSCLGFFPLCPGKPEYVIGSPRFGRVTLHLPGGKDFVIEAHGPVDATPQVDEVRLNGQPLASVYLPHAAVAAGGRLEFQMRQA